MKKGLLITSLMISTMSSYNVIAACPSGMTPNATGNCSKSVDGCDDGTGNKKCRIEYKQIVQADNSVTYDVIVKPKDGAMGNIELKNHDVKYYVDSVRNLTIEDGITELGALAISAYGSGTLKLPSTLTTMSGAAIYSVGFTTIDVSDVKNLQSSGVGYTIAAGNTIGIAGAYNLQNLIVSEEGSSITFGYSYEHQFPSGTVNIQCKGDPDVCEGKVSYPATATWLPEDFDLEADYYVKKDSNGNIIESWDENGGYLYDSGGNLVRQIDGNGNVLWRRRIYTVQEANKASKPTGNRVSIRYK